MISDFMIREICCIDSDIPIRVLEFRLYKDIVAALRQIGDNEVVVVRIMRHNCTKRNAVVIAEMIRYHLKDDSIHYRTYPSSLYIKYFK